MGERVSVAMVNGPERGWARGVGWRGRWGGELGRVESAIGPNRAWVLRERGMVGHGTFD